MCSIITGEIITVPRGWPVFWSNLSQLRNINTKLWNIWTLCRTQRNTISNYSCQQRYFRFLVRSDPFFSSVLFWISNSIQRGEPAGINIIRYMTNTRGCYCVLWDSYFIVARRSMFTAWKLENSPRMLNREEETQGVCEMVKSVFAIQCCILWNNAELKVIK